MSDVTPELDEQTLELLDLYACGALDDIETARAARIIENSPQARVYVDETQSVFAQFEDNAEHSPELLNRIKQSLHGDEQESQEAAHVVKLNPARKKSSTYLAFLSGAVAASILAIVITAAIWPSTESNQSAFSMEAELQKFGSLEDVKTVSLSDADGNTNATLMMGPEGDVMVDARNISPLDENYTYQLWAVIETATGQQVISAGVLGNAPGIYMARVHGNVTAFAITKEESGGVEKSSRDPSYSATV